MAEIIGENDKKYLLMLARKTIEMKEKKIWLSSNQIEELSNNLKQKKGGFVTLNLDNNLRGCIGYILPLFPLYHTIIENAYNAAYSDPRFEPVTEEEVDKLHIEISVLSVPEKMVYNNAEELLEKLNPLKDGVIIKKGFYSSTFLPQVWEQIPEKEIFMSHLCLKAGLNGNEWEKGKLEVETYHADVFEEGRD
jgi:AmmeMemoRadiSam system protein A